MVIKKSDTHNFFLILELTYNSRVYIKCSKVFIDLKD